jgi:hypothetical protein
VAHGFSAVMSELGNQRGSSEPGVAAVMLTGRGAACATNRALRHRIVPT